jgi:hypothetical protein
MKKLTFIQETNVCYLLNLMNREKNRPKKSWTTDGFFRRIPPPPQSGFAAPIARAFSIVTLLSNPPPKASLAQRQEASAHIEIYYSGPP